MRKENVSRPQALPIRRRRPIYFPAGFGLIVMLVPGCYTAPATTEAQLSRGCIFMLPGVESGAWQLEKSVLGLREAGIDQAIRIIEWGDRPLGSLANLINYEKNRQRAADIAREIAACRQAHPNAPVTLLGYSGGAGIAVLAAERLPPGVRLDRLILLAAALSPAYDLRGAKHRCAGQIVNFYSHGDWFTLGMGTCLLGTIDRRCTIAAGRSGFDPANLPEGVVQIPWTPHWALLGNDGGHVGWLAQDWSREILATWIPHISSATEPAAQ